MLARKLLEEIIPIKWPEVIRRRINEIEELFKADASKELIHALTNELDGGVCRKCNVEWRERLFKYEFGQGRYYEPKCYCYPVCPHCDRKLYDDFLSGRMRVNEDKKLYCSNCGWKLADGDNQRWGPGWKDKIEAIMKTDYRKKARGNYAKLLWKNG